MGPTSLGPDAPPPLRVGLLLDTLVQPRWSAALIEDLLASPIVDVALVVVNGLSPDSRRGWLNRLWADHRHLAYHAYTTLDRALFSVELDASTRVDVADRLADLPVLTVAPTRQESGERFPAETLHYIQGYDLDVAVQPEVGTLRGGTLPIARYGVWSIRHGNPPGFWEVMRGDPVSGCALQVRGDDLSSERVLTRGTIATYRLSVRRNLNRLHWKARPFLIRKLTELHHDGPAALAPPPGDVPPPPTPVTQQPGNLAMIGWGVCLLARILHEKLTKWLTVGQWALAVDVQPGRSGPAESLDGFRLIRPPRDRFWADPFPLEKDGRMVLFFEEYMFKSGIGRIVAAEVSPSGRLLGEPRPVLERDSHLSYPFVFEWQETLYLIPEMAQAGTVELYRCRAFPHEWELAATLLDGVRAVDATLAEIDGRWWMFVGLPVEGGVERDAELHLYHADTPLGPWRPHRRNPVNLDVRGARPAGRLYQRDGVWLRPAQDCSVNYGYAITLHRIERLDPEHYVETPLKKILPDWHTGLIGTHTLNASGPLTVTDGLFRRRRF